MKGFGIFVKNNLLEPKHVENMGEAVWLYLWFLDKMTSVNENGVGKILGGQPIKYEIVQVDLGLSVRSYRRWLDRLRDTGYIDTLRTPHGLIVTVNKAEKIFKKRSAKSGTSKVKSDVPNSPSDVPKMVKRSANLAHVNKDIIPNGIIQRQYKDNTSIGASAEDFKNVVGKMYYEAIKSLGLPVRNHTNLKAKIAEMAHEDDPQNIVNYLMFIRDQYQTTDWDYKPDITESLDIYHKRIQVRETMQRAVKQQQQIGSNVWVAS